MRTLVQPVTRSSTECARRSTATRSPGAAQAAAVKAGVLCDRAEVLGAMALVIADTDRLRSAGLAPIGAGDKS